MYLAVLEAFGCTRSYRNGPVEQPQSRMAIQLNGRSYRWHRIYLLTSLQTVEVYHSSVPRSKYIWSPKPTLTTTAYYSQAPTDSDQRRLSDFSGLCFAAPSWTCGFSTSLRWWYMNTKEKIFHRMQYWSVEWKSFRPVAVIVSLSNLFCRLHSCSKTSECSNPFDFAYI
jgi:hypothetical protein